MERHGQKWTEEEIQQLNDEISLGMRIEEIAQNHQRSIRAIQYKFICKIPFEQNLTIYILELEQGKYYVGSTTNLSARLLAHIEKSATEWTNKYGVVSLLITYLGDRFDEDTYTKRYMEKYGIENVRGGSYSSITTF